MNAVGFHWVRWIAVAMVLVVAPVRVRGADTTAVAETNQVFFVDTAPVLKPEAEEAVGAWRFENYVSPALRIPDGFTDGGHAMGIAANKRLTSSRELLVVDRAKDSRLREHIAVARSQEVTGLPPLDRAMRLASYVDKLFTKNGRRKASADQAEVIGDKYKNRGVLLGDVEPICGGGACRHRMLLFKVLADEAGLSVAMVRGKYRHSDGRLGQHAWNELYLDDGSVFLVDIMNPPHGMKFPRIQEPSVGRKYLGQSGAALYDKPHVVWAPCLRVASNKNTAAGSVLFEIVPPELGAPVLYTLDGSAPTKESIRYKKPVEVKNGITLKAAAVYPDGFISRIAEKTVPKN